MQTRCWKTRPTAEQGWRPNSASFRAYNGAMKARKSFWASWLQITTIPVDLMEEWIQSQVSVYSRSNSIFGGVHTFSITLLSFIGILPDGSALRLIPEGLVHETGTKCIIGNGVVVDPKLLL